MNERATINPHAAANAFATDYRHLEYALKRAPEYRRKNKATAEADWGAFATALGPTFFDQIVRSGVAKNLIGKPPRRLLNDMKWAPTNPAPLSNVSELIINGVCRVRHNYFHGEKFTGASEGQWDRDITLIQEAHAVLVEAIGFFFAAARSEMDPRVRPEDDGGGWCG